MLSTAMQSWFRRTQVAPPAAVQAARAPPFARREPPAEVPQARPTAWPGARLGVSAQLWGPGFTLPGGEIEILRLARPIGLSSASNLLLVGVGSGGPATSVVRNLGAWVTGLEADPVLLREAERVVKAGPGANKAKIEGWTPDRPEFEQRRHHHCLGLEPLRSAQPEPILDGLAHAVKPGGQLVMTELVADAPLAAHDPTAAHWVEMERREGATLSSTVAVTRMLGRVGFDVRAAEDITERHIHNVLIGWRIATRALGDQRPNSSVGAQLLAEAEMWLLRVQLLREGRLRMIRWHAVARPVSGGRP